MFPTQMLNFDSAAMYQNWLDDMRDAQDARGYEPPIAPNPGIFYDGAWNGVWWSGMIVYLPWELYQYTGDEKILADNYSAMKGYVDWLRSIEGKTKNWCPQPQPLGPGLNHTNMSLSGLTIWGLGDWGEVGADGFPKRTPVALTATCGSAYFNRLVSATAKILGNDSDADFYAQESARITDALNKTFLDPDTGWYATHSQTGQLLPLVLDLVPPDKRSLVTDKLAASIAASDNHLSTGFEGTPFLLTGLCDVGLSDLAWTVATQPGAPSWLDIIFTRKNSTFMEYWDGRGVQMPACQGPIGEWFIRDLAGINPAAPGFKKILIKPSVVGDLKWVKAYFDSPYGRIVSNWKIERNQLTMDVTIPANTTATVVVPGKNGGSHEVGSGLYHFTSGK
jgi:alpha-L-rhamnosidase